MVLHPHRVGGVGAQRWLVGVGLACILSGTVEFPDDVLQGVCAIRSGGEEAGEQLDICGKQWGVDNIRTSDVEVGTCFVLSDPAVITVARVGQQDGVVSGVDTDDFTFAALGLVFDVGVTGNYFAVILAVNF